MLFHGFQGELDELCNFKTGEMQAHTNQSVLSKLTRGKLKHLPLEQRRGGKNSYDYSAEIGAYL
jgi:hypothetical protein